MKTKPIRSMDDKLTCSECGWGEDTWRQLKADRRFTIMDPPKAPLMVSSVCHYCQRARIPGATYSCPGCGAPYEVSR